MLGNSTLQNWYAQQDGIYAIPKIIAEWNANALSQPYVYGDGNGSFSEVSTISGLTPSTGSIGGNSKKFTITIPYTTSAIATEYSFTHTVSTATAGKSYKLSMFAQADKVIDVLIVATAKNSSGEILSQSSTNINVGPSKLVPFLIECNQYNENDLIKYMDYTISIINEVYTESISLTIDSLRVYEIDQYELMTNRYLSVKDVFSINRPGDSYMYGSTSAGNGNVSPYNIAWKNLLKKTSSTNTWNSIRNFLPAFNAAFKYYMYNGVSTNEIFAKYSSRALVNKLIIKVNVKQVVPSSIKIYTLTTKDGTFSGTADATISSPFDSNGLCELFWSGSTWTKTPWTTVPTYIDQSISLSKEIYGVKVEFTSTTGEVHLVEISPRLELNLSSYVTDFSVTNELSNDSLPTPIGVANSDTATVNFENLPVYNGSSYIQPFDNYTGTLAGMLKKNVVFKIIVSTNVNGTWTDQQIAKMITSSWSNNGIDSCSVELFDSIKVLSQIQSPAFYRSAANVGIMISTLLDAVGFTDYNYDELMDISTTYLKNSTIENYWTITQANQSVLESLQQLLLPYQISMYVNEYGVIKFKHIQQIIQSQPESLYKITSQQSGNIKPNIIDFTINDENMPSKASVEYANIYPSVFTDLSSGLRKAGREDIQNVFPKQVLGYLRLAENLSANSRSMSVYIKTGLDASLIDSHSGYVLVDSEIIKFDGIEYTFIVVYDGNPVGQIVKRVLKSKSEIESVRAEFLSSQNVTAVYESEQNKEIKKLRNLTRGCFGTKAVAHTVGSSASDFSSSTSGAFTSNGEYINLNKVASVVSHNSTCNANTRIFSASFIIPETVSIPSDGTEVDFGLQIGASSGNNNAIRVGVKLYNKKNTDGTIVYTYSLVIRQYDSSGTELTSLNKKYDLESYKIDKAGNPVSIQRYMFNTNGENSIAAVFVPGAQDNLDKMIVMINGNVIKFSDTKDEITLSSTSSLNFVTNNFPAFKLNSAPSFSGTKLSVFTNGVIPIKLAELQGFEVLPPSDSNGTIKLLNILATVMYGNLLGLSNKDELESVISGTKVSELAAKIGYISKAVAREIKEINADFTQTKFPVLYSYILRNSYTLETPVQEGSDTIVRTTVIPSDSVTFSRIDHTPTSARLAMINSYSSPVYINAESYSSFSISNNITQMFGAILIKNSTSKLTADINNDNSNTEIAISSDWVQNENAAQKILSSLVSASVMKNNSIDVTIFGNPLIMVGDVFNVEHHLKNFTGKYAVVSVSKDFNNGINTSLSLRRISE